MEQWWKQLFGVIAGQKVWSINQDRSMGMRIWSTVLALFWEFLSPAKVVPDRSVCMCSFSCVQLFVTLWAVARQAPLSMGFSRQEYWSGLPFPPPGDLPDPGAEPTSLMSPALAGRFFTTSATWEVSSSQRIQGSQGNARELNNPHAG